MSGIYLHIPFCRQSCSYCNFHFTINLNHKDDLVRAILKEMEIRRDYLQGEKIETVYFGGGTPTLLSTDELKRIFEKLQNIFQINEKAEITIEANPDDLTEQKIRELRTTPVNRFSIGIQSFHNDDLRLLNRAHNSTQAESSVKLAQDCGFENITIDLIYGIPGEGKGTRNEGRNKGNDTAFSISEKWLKNLEKLRELGIPHFSAYCLTVEQKTILEKLIRENKVADVNDEAAARQFEMLMDFAVDNGYDHYEISNFAKEGCYSRHNTSYWMGKKYLGLGPSAHSYDGNSRQWNIANNTLYIQSLQNDMLNFEGEELTDNDRFNEYLMTSLRTKWGVDKNYLQKKFEAVKLLQFENATLKYLNDGMLVAENEIVKLTRSGKLIADRIISDLFEIN